MIITLATPLHHSTVADLGLDYAIQNGQPIVRVPDGTDQQIILDEIAAHDPMPVARREAKDSVDKAAEEARLRYVTPGSGQAAVYAAKLRQAEAYQAAGYPVDATAYPLIEADAQAVGITEQQAADAIIAIAAQWEQVAAIIERIRLAAKKQIDSATDYQTAQQIAADAITQLGAV